MIHPAPPAVTESPSEIEIEIESLGSSVLVEKTFLTFAAEDSASSHQSNQSIRSCSWYLS